MKTRRGSAAQRLPASTVVRRKNSSHRVEPESNIRSVSCCVPFLGLGFASDFVIRLSEFIKSLCASQPTAVASKHPQSPAPAHWLGLESPGTPTVPEMDYRGRGPRPWV